MSQSPTAAVAKWYTRQQKYFINKQIIEGQAEHDCFKRSLYSNHDSNSYRIMLIGYRLVGKIKSYLDIWGPHGKISSCEEECRQIFPCDKPVGTLLCNLNLPRKRDGKNTIYLSISTSKNQILHRSVMTHKLPITIPSFESKWKINDFKTNHTCE